MSEDKAIDHILEHFQEMDEGNQLAVEQMLIQTGHHNADSVDSLKSDDNENSDLEVIRQFIPEDSETESKTDITHDQAVSLTQLEMWPELLGIEDPEFERQINDFITQFEKRRISASNGREQYTKILSAVANAEFDDDGNAKSGLSKLFATDEDE